MTVTDDIIQTLRATRGGLCDDCLTSRAQLSRRQVAFQYCERLAEQGKVERGTGPCAICHKSGKNITWIEPGSGDSIPPPAPRVSMQPRVPTPVDKPPQGDQPVRDINGALFARICAIEPERDAAGALIEFRPDHAADYAGRQPHADGEGPFIRFRLKGAPTTSGVYALYEDEKLVYLGEAVDLKSRWNVGYGQISPRNCFPGGQPTNCRVNKLIREGARHKHAFSLWFHETPDYKGLEAQLIGQLRPPWNRKGL